MAVICEFMAPIGTGKSTLIEGIIKNHKETNLRLGSEELAYSIKKNRFKKLFLRKPKRELMNLDNFRDKLGKKYPSFPEIFLESLIENKLQNNGLNYIYKRFIRGVDNIAKIEYFKSYKDLDIILIEDNFIRYSDILEVNELNKKNFLMFSRLIPLPDLIVYLHIPLELNLNRLIRRTEKNIGRKLKIQEINQRQETLIMLHELHKKYFDFLIKEYNIKYLIIDASKDISNNQNEILNFLNTEFKYS